MSPNSQLPHAVVDADCLVAGTLASTGAAQELLDAWQDGRFELIVCPRLIYEVRKTLEHPRVSKKYGITQQDTLSLATRLKEEGILLDDPKNPPRVVPHDPNDDYLVALALKAESVFLVTRDRHFSKVRVEGLAILNPRQFLDQLQSRGTWKIP